MSAERWPFFAGILAAQLLLATAPAVAGEVVTVELPDIGEVALSEDHRVPLVWVSVAFPVGELSAWWWSRDLELLWRPMVRPRREDRPDRRFHPWSGSLSCGVDFLVLHTELEEAVTTLSAALASDYADFTDRIPRLVMRSEWADGRQSPTAQLDRALASLFYQREDPRANEDAAPRFRQPDPERLRLRRSRVLATPGRRVAFAGDLAMDEAIFWARELLVPALAKAEGADPVPAARAPPALEDVRGQERTVEVRGTTEVLLALARDGLAAEDARAPAAILADAVVARRLERIVRGSFGDSYAVETSGLLAIHPDIYRLQATASPERARTVEATMLGVLAAVAQSGLSSAEIDAARTALHMAALRELTAPQDVLSAWLTERFLVDHAPTAVGLDERAERAPEAEVVAFARAFYAPEAFARTRVVPGGWKREEAARVRRGE